RGGAARRRQHRPNPRHPRYSLRRTRSAVRGPSFDATARGCPRPLRGRRVTVRRSLRRLGRYARAGLGMAVGMIAYPAAWFGWFRPRDKLAAAVGELLLIGFYGASSSSPSARLLARQARRGQVGAVFFVSQNIGTADEVAGLLRLFR